MQKGFWEDENSIYRECRSVVIDLHKEQLVITPFRKFFNLNEVSENHVDKIQEKIKTAKVVEVANKLDGSMQNATWHNDKLFMTGSMAIDKSDSWRLQDGVSMLTENHVMMLKTNPNFTFTFEYISKEDTHVVIYDEKDYGLHLIGIRNKETGEQLSYEDVRFAASIYNVQVVDMETKTLDEMLIEMKQHKSHEKKVGLST